MTQFLGEVVMDAAHTPYASYGPREWALLYLTKYGGLEDIKHKTWLLDQIARLMNNAPVTIKQARWEDGREEYSFEVGTSAEYEAWADDETGVWKHGRIQMHDVGTPP